MKPWKAILAAVVIFLAGIASGVLAAHLYRLKTQSPARSALPGGPPSPWTGQRLEFMRRLGDKLDLNPSQREQIDRAIDDAQRSLRELWQPVEPLAKEQMTSLRRRIEAELTPVQKARFEALLKARATRPSGETNYNRRHEGTNSGVRPRKSGTNPPPQSPVARPGPGSPDR